MFFDFQGRKKSQYFLVIFLLLPNPTSQYLVEIIVISVPDNKRILWLDLMFTESCNLAKNCETLVLLMTFFLCLSGCFSFNVFDP